MLVTFKLWVVSVVEPPGVTVTGVVVIEGAPIKLIEAGLGTVT